MSNVHNLAGEEALRVLERKFAAGTKPLSPALVEEIRAGMFSTEEDSKQFAHLHELHAKILELKLQQFMCRQSSW